MAFLTRVVSGARVSWASSVTFATVGTAVTTLALLPLLDIAFDVLMGADLASDDLVRTGYAACLVSLAVTVASGVVSAVATDRNLGVFQEVCTLRRLDPAYWLAVSLVPLALATVTGVLSVGAVFVLSPGHDVALLARVLLLSLGALACGVLLGVGAAGLGVSLPDPYLGATLLASALPVLIGVIVPVSAYPAWLRVVSQVTPLSGAVSTLTAGGPALVLRDLALSAVWCAAGLVVSQVAVHRLRQGTRYDTV